MNKDIEEYMENMFGKKKKVEEELLSEDTQIFEEEEDDDDSEDDDGGDVDVDDIDLESISNAEKIKLVKHIIEVAHETTEDEKEFAEFMEKVDGIISKFEKKTEEKDPEAEEPTDD